MSIRRIGGVIIQELFITKHSLEVIIDLFFWSVISTVVYGFVTTYFSQQTGAEAALYMLLGLLLWEIVRIMQYSTSVSALWNVWSRNLSNMFISPLSMNEYLLAQIISGAIKAMCSFTLVCIIAATFFHFSMLRIGLINIIFNFINLSIFSISIGLILLGAIFKFGPRIQALAWSFIFLFQPLNAALFPLNVLPEPLQTFARFFPMTYVFEAARFNLTDSTPQWDYIGIAFAQNIIYLIFALWIFNYLFKKSKESGQFARNEG